MGSAQRYAVVLVVVRARDAAPCGRDSSLAVRVTCLHCACPPRLHLGRNILHMCWVRHAPSARWRSARVRAAWAAAEHPTRASLAPRGTPLVLAAPLKPRRTGDGIHPAAAPQRGAAARRARGAPARGSIQPWGKSQPRGVVLGGFRQGRESRSRASVAASSGEAVSVANSHTAPFSWKSMHAVATQCESSAATSCVGRPPPMLVSMFWCLSPASNR